ncbi:MAG TPA: IS4 family transposase [Leptospiraceae bacterium]|jgi:transposase|uniref:Transposase IS4-like domain-containing protein n=2 Tax=cellular organisms TaxID=131567 RepID=A0A0D6QSX9_ARACU|nr:MULTISPECIES: IS4 family transposase [Weeksellaceae]UOE39866.1 IS4 family transposase [Chryseobacterium suipulveris]UOE39873.1 IS4 family transposase [Chryseobacterium suipulveris]HNC01666.1 IS4 family transposase [Leptospiraceae bacterium]
MSVFKDHKISLKQVLEFIPEALLTHLSATSKVDHYSKVLHGKKMFYLLLFCIFDNEKLSQRTLEDTFNSSGFKALFGLGEEEKVRRSSISERLSKIDSNYFKEIYEQMYGRFSELYSKTEIEKYNLIRVDSTIVADTCAKLKEGIDQKSGKKLVKFSFSFDGILPSGVEVFTGQKYSSEEAALPEAILKQVKKEEHHENIYVIDRGLQSTRVMKDFDEKSVKFIIRSKENRKFEEIESFLDGKKSQKWDDWEVMKDSKVKLYTGKPVLNKRGNIHHREEKVETCFRLVVIKNEKKDKEFWFLTNEFELSAKEIADYYRKRWDIEVFFRFLKQELNLSHLVSMNKNGIEVMIYMTMIASMLLLIYKKVNDLGYKTAKRRIAMEIRDMITAILIIFAGGNPDKVFKT